MKNEQWEQVWLACEAARSLEGREAAGEAVPADVEQLFADNLPAVDIAYAELRPRLDNLSDQPAANVALYDSLLTSSAGETAASICWRAIAQVRGEPEPEPRLAQPAEPTTPSSPEQADQKYPPDDPELFARVLSEDEDERRQAQTELVEHYGNFVRMKARQLYRRLPKNPGVDYDDLEQEGVLGMLHAAELYKPGRGVSFVHYTSYGIEQCIKRHYQYMCNTVRVPIHIRAKLNKAETLLNDQHWHQHLSSLRIAEVAQVAGVEPDFYAERSRRVTTVGNLLQAKMLSNHIKSTDRGFSPDYIGSNNNYVAYQREGGMASLTDMNPPCGVEDEIMAASLRADLEGALGNLPERERNLLRMRFGSADGKPHTLEECRQALGLSSKELARQIESRALARLRVSGKVQSLLKPYLEESATGDVADN